MDEELDPSVIKATQVSLGKYVKRPPLSEKLLRKPPFRFLHDIVTSVLKSKGFFDGLFEEHELISDNVKDRESKILFLSKVISVVSLTTGQSLSVKPSKVVAGQEAAKTNELLQCLAQALDKNLSSHDAVKHVKEGVKIPSKDKKNNEPEEPKSVKKSVESKKLPPKSSEKLATKDKNKQLTKSKHKENAVSKKESPPKKTLPKEIYKKVPERSNKEVLPQDLTTQTPSEEKNNVISNITTEKVGQDHIEQNKSLASNSSTLSIDSKLNESIIQSETNLQEESLKNEANNLEKQTASDDVRNSAPIAENIIVENNQISIDKKENDQEMNVNNELLIISTKADEINFNAQEHTNKYANDEHVKLSEELPKTGHHPYDIKNISGTIAVRPSSVRPSSSRPGAPRHRDKNDIIINDTENVIVGKVNIISENVLQEEEEDTSIVIDSQIKDGLQDIQENKEHNEIAGNQNSHLVQQILDAHKEYSQMTGKTEIEWQIGTQKTSDVFIHEMEQLRFSVQAMSRIANPLGKLLDHIQEDVEVMRQELQQWTNLYEETSKDLIKQKTANEESLGPFHTKVKHLSKDIEEKREKIIDLKVCIHKNASKIEKLLANGNVQ